MNTIKDLFDNNKQWASDIQKRFPGFFNTLAKQQSPKYLWIGCADSRVPANEIVGLAPGELFVHRNVANIVVHNDINCMSVIQYAVAVLKVEHVIVCGHYGCGGVQAAMGTQQLGLIDSWLTNIKDTLNDHMDDIQKLGSDKEKVDRLCELNVMRQVKSLSHTSFIQNAWREGRELTIHGMIYSIEDGLLKSLDVSVDCIDQVEQAYHFD